MQLWLPESIVADLAPDGTAPDAIVVLVTETGSGVLCLEIDEATQHIAPIHDKLRAYHRALDGRRGWHALFVVPSAARRSWLLRVAARLDLAGADLWTVVAVDLGRAGIGVPLTRLGGQALTAPLRDVLVDPRSRLSATPVASRAWLELLGSGGGEDVARSTV